MLKIKKESIPLIIITFSIIIAAISFYCIPFSGGDNFAYFHLSRAIAEGKGYVELWNPHTPLHTKYPPLFPVLLLPATIGNSYILAKIIIFLCYVSLLFFSYLLFKELNKSESKKATLIAILFLAFAPVLIEYSKWVLSEVPYMLISVLSLYYWNKKKHNISLLFATLAFLTRTIGLTLVLPVNVFYLLKFKENKQKLIFPLLSFLSIFSWFFYGFLKKDPSEKSYLHSLLMKNPYNINLGNIGVIDFIVRIVQNIRKMITTVFPELFWGRNGNFFTPVSSEIKLASLFLGIIITILVLFGILGDRIFIAKTAKEKKGGYSKKSTINLINLYFILYLLATWSWPTIWAEERRFYLPILPLIVFFMGRGIINCLKTLPKNYRKDFLPFIIPGILAAHCIFVFLTCAPTLWNNNINWNKNKIYPYTINHFNPYINLKKWADRKKIPDNSLFIAEKRRVFYHLTGFCAAEDPRRIYSQNFENIVEKYKIEYIVVCNKSHSKKFLYGGMKEIINEYDFSPVYVDPSKSICVIKCNKKDISSDNEESEGALNQFLRKIGNEELENINFDKVN